MTLTTGYPDDNPKTIFGDKKIPLHLAPMSAMHAMAEGFADGAKKYGPFNWREKMVSSTVYYAAALRHLAAWFDGEEIAEDSGMPHLSHALACLAIIVDAASIGKLNDNRPPKGASGAIQAAWVAKRDLQAAVKILAEQFPLVKVTGNLQSNRIHTSYCQLDTNHEGKCARMIEGRPQVLSGCAVRAAVQMEDVNRAIDRLAELREPQAACSDSSGSGSTQPLPDRTPAQGQPSARDQSPTPGGVVPPRGDVRNLI